ncbi:hypothetical protein IWX46DRAFT_334498 [Phyllosticta citricarpa]|uniref:Uncharacterized protein n=1 Tax=Phyllosticta citricarpa TaxID=55181 RepID=A0ABR1LGD3_9PEZI
MWALLTNVGVSLQCIHPSLSLFPNQSASLVNQSINQSWPVSFAAASQRRAFNAAIGAHTTVSATCTSTRPNRARSTSSSAVAAAARASNTTAIARGPKATVAALSTLLLRRVVSAHIHAYKQTYLRLAGIVSNTPPHHQLPLASHSPPSPRSSRPPTKKSPLPLLQCSPRRHDHLPFAPHPRTQSQQRRRVLPKAVVVQPRSPSTPPSRSRTNSKTLETAWTSCACSTSPLVTCRCWVCLL